VFCQRIQCRLDSSCAPACSVQTAFPPGLPLLLFCMPSLRTARRKSSYYVSSWPRGSAIRQCRYCSSVPTFLLRLHPCWQELQPPDFFCRLHLVLYLKGFSSILLNFADGIQHQYVVVGFLQLDLFFLGKVICILSLIYYFLY